MQNHVAIVCKIQHTLSLVRAVGQLDNRVPLLCSQPKPKGSFTLQTRKRFINLLLR
jgi:hypothetical protein